MKLLIPLLLCGVLHATDDCFGIPDWILPGILWVESHSVYETTGGISVGDRRTGAAGERGCFQITRAAFDTVRKPGDSFAMLERSPDLCERIAADYLIHLHKRFGSWVNAIQAFNAGRPGTRAGRRYLNKIYRAMGMN